MPDFLEQIQHLWIVEQEILNVIDQICHEHGLKYSLAYGTLIGAVRHKGFIPWDDDIDIVMPRDDYEKLLKIWNDVAPEGYLLQNIRTNDDFTQNFTKIRKDHTTFLQFEWEREKSYHKGVFVDIFPGDRVAPGRFSRLVQFILCAVNLLYSRGFVSGSGGMVGLVEKILIHLPQKWHKILRSWSERKITRWKDDPSLQWFFPSTITAAKNYYSPNLFNNMTNLEFCDRQYCCTADFDQFLRTDYGDYMKLPPEEKRVWTHHPLIIDFKHSYEELV